MEATDISWDVICLSETRAADGEFLLEGGHILFCGRGDSIYAGAAILIHKRWVQSCIFHIAYSYCIFISIFVFLISNGSFLWLVPSKWWYMQELRGGKSDGSGVGGRPAPHAVKKPTRQFC